MFISFQKSALRWNSFSQQTWGREPSCSPIFSGDVCRQALCQDHAWPRGRADCTPTPGTGSGLGLLPIGGRWWEVREQALQLGRIPSAGAWEGKGVMGAEN